MRKQTLVEAIEALRAGAVPVLPIEDFSCFSKEATEGNPHVSERTLDEIAQQLTQADIPVFECAVKAMDEGDLAWLGFKIVYDGVAAVENVDNEVTKKYGNVGSADADSMVFFCNDAKEAVASREWSPRDFFQMKDVTRGPSMHCEQFDGLTWTSVPLFDNVRVWLLGASDASSEVAALAHHVGFDVVAVDYDSEYLNDDRFPDAERVLVEGFEGVNSLSASSDDYACVLTRGHMWDPQACLWASRQGMHYIGMMGCAGKNSTVHDLCIQGGMTEGQWDAVKRPIGLNFGAKTPAELAIAIVAELVDVRYKQRYSEESRARHDEGLGRN